MMGDPTRWGRRLRGLFLVVGAGLLLLVFGPRLVPTGDLKDQLVREVERATGAEVVLGRASLQLVPRLAVTVDGGSLRGTGAALAAATGADVDLESYGLELSSIEVALAIGPLLRGQVTVASARLKGPALQLAWDGGDMVLADFRARFTGLALGLDADTTAVAFDLEVAADGATTGGARYDDVSGEGRFADRVLVITALRADQGPGEIRATGTLDYRADPRGRLEFEALVDGVPADLLLGPWVPDLARRLAADLDAAVKGSCALGNDTRVRRSLRLVGRAASGPGRLAAQDWLTEAGPYLGDRQDLKIVNFDRLDHAFRLEQGRYHLARLDLTGGPTEWGGAGWIDLAGRMDLALRVRLPSGFTPDLGAFSFMAEGLRDDQGRVNLAFDLRGPTVRPAFAVDLASLMGKSRRPDDTAAVAEIEKGMGGLLDKWEGR
jgi:hypothetical protein